MKVPTLISLAAGEIVFLAKPTLLHFVLPFFFAQNSTFATSSFWGSGQYLMSLLSSTARLLRLVNHTHEPPKPLRSLPLRTLDPL